MTRKLLQHITKYCFVFWFRKSHIGFCFSVDSGLYREYDYFALTTFSMIIIFSLPSFLHTYVECTHLYSVFGYLCS
jgi:hypothetical protein